ncbi:MAG: GGDEF domain-containing protein [Alphaproteobacteria bacterium]|nr:GGDEF domain-containing protein [Alphaproteobacteria bacterium]
MSHSRILELAGKLFAHLARPAATAPRERALTDGLSGLLNTEGFVDGASLALAAAGGLPVSAIVFDIDAFAAVNRAGGPAAGDRVIAALGSIVAEAITDRHVAGRIGGEAFAVVLPGLDLGATRLFAEAVRIRFSACDFGEEVPWKLTVSAGAAERRPDEPLHAMVARADRALHAAKQAGRDRVFVATDVPDVEHRMQTA